LPISSGSGGPSVAGVAVSVRFVPALSQLAALHPRERLERFDEIGFGLDAEFGRGRVLVWEDLAREYEPGVLARVAVVGEELFDALAEVTLFDYLEVERAGHLALLSVANLTWGLPLGFSRTQRKNWAASRAVRALPMP